MILTTFFIVLAYLMGSICSAVIVCKTCSLPDPCTKGSNNPGATNVLRLAGKKYATLVLVADLLKGTIPVLIAKMFETNPASIGFVALAAVIGHMYPIFFGYKGGKGVATAIGALLGFQFIVGIMVAATWLLVAKFFRYSSLASIISIFLAPFYGVLVTGQINVSTPLFLIALLIISKHKNNINRLLEGTEPKIKLKHENILDEVMKDDAHPVVMESAKEEKIAVVKTSKKPPAKKKVSAKKPKAEKS